MIDLDAMLQQKFGFSAFRPGQRELIEATLRGQDALGILPTGSGKTLCYQLPGRLQPGLVVVVEPLLALMADQVARLQARGERRVVALGSDLSPDEARFVKMHLADYRFLFISPEMLLRGDVQALLRQLTISLFVVDEAHCISQWGPDFRPAYLQLGNVIHALKPRSVLALTATAPNRVQQDIVNGLGLRQPFAFIASVDRPNIFMGVMQVADAQSKHTDLLAVTQAVQGPKILYFDRRQQAEEVAAQLQEKGQYAAFYHAGMTASARELVARQFMVDQVDVICATSAFGMGIDKPDVRLVCYTYLPESLEAFTQGIGRAGRDGAQSAALLLLAPADMARASQFASTLPDAKMIKTIFAHPELYTKMNDPQIDLIEAYIQSGFSEAETLAKLTARLAEKQASLQAMVGFVNAPGCKRAALVAHFDDLVPTHTDLCCGELTPAVIAQLAPATAVKSQAPQAWQAVFKQIFTFAN
ncbi:RecQ family ATP-dependent DNA helicase [Lacticaseibacillus yichunensis]|uniref:RecQ family ATP-dependent DNA helicase n=1 Tax=Lacticaseibacillus yichunensis TaxID=2486015 RepID=A0ABW4CQF0_9LACO|nr:RecQ family ATP-dependent DNA helicase [Lacticaseibacillus yichunensis]